jgi:hypothetical protein
MDISHPKYNNYVAFQNWEHSQYPWPHHGIYVHQKAAIPLNEKYQNNMKWKAMNETIIELFIARAL